MKAGDEDVIHPDSVASLAALFRERVARSPDALAYQCYESHRQRWRRYTWAAMGREVARWQVALAGEGLMPGERVAVMLPNGHHWVCFDQAALGLGLVVVPLYSNDRADNIAYILRATGARLLLMEGGEAWQALRRLDSGLDGLQRIVLRHPVADRDPRIVALDAWLPAGEAADDLRVLPVARDALATIVYTSGTVGRPKGVMLSHGNLLWNAHAAHCCNPVRPDDVFLSFLPLSHTLERTVGYYLPMMAGAAVAYARSVVQLAEDLQIIRPSVIISVPRIYERVYARIREQLEERSALARWLFACAVAVGWSRFEHAQGRAAWRPSHLAWPLLRRLVAGKVLARLGGRIRIAVCGGAPLSPEVARVFIGLGLPLVQGYGMTEASPVVSANSLEDNEPASVGRALRDVELRLDARGELLVKSPGVMLGYWNDPEATAQAIDAEGWLHTGDTAEIRQGRIYITGRLKEIIVLSTGEKVPPADMEMAIARDPLFEQVMVVGEGRPYLAALVVLNRERWAGLARRLGLDAEDPAALREPRLRDELCARIGTLIRDFPGYARIHRVAALLEPWTVEGGLLTPTLKLRRARIRERFRKEIAELYAGH